MKKIKNGDIVGRISYNKDIIFIVKDIRDKNNVILEGIFERIIADSNIDDLEVIDEKVVNVREKINEINEAVKEIFDFTQKNETVKADFDEYLATIGARNIQLSQMEKIFLPWVLIIFRRIIFLEE